MLEIFDPLRELSTYGLVIRMLLAFACGGIIGIEREYRRRPAGFRTHILICTGSAVTIMTNQFLFLELHASTDIARMGAQVIAGIGFIGAGSIIVTKRQRVKGLTTAAGLWATAIIGLCIGGGFYEGGVAATGLILITELCFSKLDHFVADHTPELNLYVKCSDDGSLLQVEKMIEEEKMNIISTEIIRRDEETQYAVYAIFLLRLHRGCSFENLLCAVQRLDGVLEAGKL